ncbi:hypothetical protein TKK_0012642 [Trichogramma kaykai]|uniref:Integrator complex subunit 14 n=1 Tax=Trichogramma kaykai TaxID=54128 RepID=A0ABD2WMI9_9HYME
MPTVIALDVSLSMRRVVVGTTAYEGIPGEQLTRHHLALQGINTILHYLQNNSKLEFVALMTFSSMYEILCPFTRDYELIRSKLQNIEECDKTSIETALHGVKTLVISEWGSSTPCQVILVTDGNPGVGPMSLRESLLSMNFPREGGIPFPVPFPFPARLSVVCLTNPTDPTFVSNMQLYQKLVDLVGSDGMVLAPEGSLSKASVSNCFKKLSETNFTTFKGYLKFGNLGSRIFLSPVPLPQTKKTDFEVVPSLMISKNIEICGFIPIADVGNPGAISRHLILPMSTEKNSSMQGIAVLDEDDEIEEVIDEGKEPSFCVLLHGALKVENMAALCLLNTDWYGFIYSWADSKKKSNLMLTVLEHGCEVVPWLGNLRNLGSISFAKDKTFEALTFPIRPVEKRSYSANTPSWIRNSGLQSDIQKILRQARKLPEKTANFYKELNRVRRTALTLGFLELLEGLAQIFDREITLLPPNVNPECAIQLSHCSEMLRKPYSKELNANISPLRTKYSGAAE